MAMADRVTLDMVSGGFRVGEVEPEILKEPLEPLDKVRTIFGVLPSDLHSSLLAVICEADSQECVGIGQAYLIDIGHHRHSLGVPAELRSRIT